MIYLEATLWCLFVGYWLYRGYGVAKFHGYKGFFPRTALYFLGTGVMLISYGKNILDRLLKLPGLF